MNQQNKTKKSPTSIGQGISLLLLTHNSSTDIKKNFNWLKKCSVINEIINIDDNSTDNTTTIIKQLISPHQKLKTKKRILNQNFSSQRQFGLTQTTNNWILWLDPDEKPSPQFIRFINNFSFQHHNYSFPRLEFFLHHQLLHGETSQLRFTRLFDKHHGKFVGQVHEIWQSSQPITPSACPIEHHSNTSLAKFFEKINFYSSIRAQELFDRQTKTNLFQIIFFPLGKFFLNYILRFGFLDSTPGIIFALGMSFHSFLVRAKLWHLWQK